LQFGFERATSRRYSPIHKDNLFDYGYIGKFGFDYVPITDTVNESIVHVGNREVFTGFTNGDRNPNPGLANYNEFANPERFVSYVATNGRFLDNYDDIWSNMHSNVNKWFDQNSTEVNDVVTVMANTGFDLKLGKTGVHNIQIGLMNEQRLKRRYEIKPYGLWNLMTLTANSHFNGLDSNRVIGQIQTPVGPVDQYATAVVDLADNKFYREARKALGIANDAYLNPNAYSPDQFNLNMFSARELQNFGLVSYYGYDHTGKQGNDGVSFNEFFTHRDAEGIRDFPIAPLRPLYQAAFIKDKFTFNNMIFSLGLRVERFDLNTKVLRDQYSLYNIMTAKDFYTAVPGYPRPTGVGDDFKVYVNSRNDPTPKAFRDSNNTWYFADGRQANDGTAIFGGSPVVPYLLDTIVGDDILNPNFNPELSFRDYTPQVNWLPRLAFSFPISDDANFFAHYDVLVQRPLSQWEVTPFSYVNFYSPAARNNANMKPEKVVDYEVGFQQKLNQNSAIKLSAYYREQRDMIQRRTLINIPVVNQYDTYDNIDFGTVKGFTLQYDLRRIQNTELRLAYTLQFADGTGTDQNSQRGLTSRGVLRTLYPLGFDERHNINAVLDYRFATGKAYNGPRIGGKDILAAFGANFQVFAVSGRPYTANTRPTRFGGENIAGQINGNRLPWRMNVDMRLDKSFALRKNLNLNVYFRVSNLLDRRNVVGVYSVTGSPTDDGFLTANEGVQVVKQLGIDGRDIQAFRDAYSWMVLKSNNYTQPRRMYIGAAFEF
jgi:outer membrane receptor protein involved in Fe transport